MGFLALMVLFLLEWLGDVHFSIFQANENSSQTGSFILKWDKDHAHKPDQYLSFSFVTLIHKSFEVYK